MKQPLWFPALSWLFTGLGTMGNSFVILLFMSKKRLIHRKTNWFLVSLSFADLGVSLSMFPGNFFCLPSKRCHFVLLACFQWAFLLTSVVNLCMLTLDRYIAITKPLRYALFMSKNRIIAFICASWLIPFIISFLPFTFVYSKHRFIALKYFTYFMLVTFEFLPTIFLLLATAHMLFIVRKHARETATMMAQLQFNQPAADSSNGAPPRQGDRRQTSVLFIVAIVFFFVFCYFVTIAMTFCNTLKLCVRPPVLDLVQKLLLIANSVFNPFAYGFLKHDVKAEVKQLLRIGTDVGQPSSNPE